MILYFSLGRIWGYVLKFCDNPNGGFMEKTHKSFADQVNLWLSHTSLLLLRGYLIKY